MLLKHNLFNIINYFKKNIISFFYYKYLLGPIWTSTIFSDHDKWHENPDSCASFFRCYTFTVFAVGVASDVSLSWGNNEAAILVNYFFFLMFYAE